MEERSPEEWDYEAAQKLKEAQGWASAHGWIVGQSGKLYQVVSGATVQYQNRSIWKVNDWLLDRVPYSFGRDTDRTPQQAITEHYQNLYVPTWEKDDTDYSLTEEEKLEIKEKHRKLMVTDTEEVKKLIKEPYQFFATPTFPDAVFILANKDGDVLKQSNSPWIILNFYQRLTGE